jgi:type III pantothenate kinase
MHSDVVADIGNSRIKWGRCGPLGIVAQATLPPDDPSAWQKQAAEWQLAAGAWALGSVQPETCARLAEWLKNQGHRVTLVDSYRKLPLEVAIESPERVGLDRLLNAVAARSRLAPGQAGILVDAGSAVTVDLVDERGAFRGGAIFPGLRLMARSLHDYTAQLPLVEPARLVPPPGTSTRTAIECGITYAWAGGVETLWSALATQYPSHVLFVTGGDAAILTSALGVAHQWWPAMTLEGLRLAAEHLGEVAE